jgi:hypothetical protein
MHKAIILAVTCLFAAAASAQQYKWVDKDGKVRYGDVPPPGANAQRLKPPPAASTAPAAPAAKSDKGEKPLSPEAAFRKRQEEAQKDRDKQAQAQQEAEAKRGNCERAQTALRALESGQRIARVDSQGERVYLEDAQIAQETERTRQIVQQDCN